LLAACDAAAHRRTERNSRSENTMKRLRIAVLAMMIACGAGFSARATTVLRLDNSAPAQLDPDKETDYSGSILAFNIYDTLVLARQGADGVGPHLASDWTNDATSYTFSLRPGVKFHNGDAITADDVKYSFDRIIGVQQGFSYLFADTVQSVDVLGPTQVRFTLKQPFAPFLASLTRLAIMDAKLVKAHASADDPWAANWIATHDAGSGAYSVVSHDPQSLTVMQKFPDYFLSVPAAAPDEVRMSYGLDAPTVRTLMASGQHDIGSQWLPPEVKAALLARPDMHALQSGGAGEFYIKMNTTKPPLDDVHCRRALVDAFDYKTALDLVRVNAKVVMGKASNGPLPVGMMGALDTPAIHQDIAAAQSELKQCKYDPKQQTIEITWVAEVPLEERYALLMQSNFAQLGFKSTITRIPWSLFSDRASKPETTPGISQIFITATTPDPDSLIYGMYDSKVPSTWQATEHLNDKEVDSLLDQARMTQDTAARSELYQQLGKRLIDLAPTIYAYDLVSVLPARGAVQVPALQNPKDEFDLDVMGFTFRLMQMQAPS
jgi:peptide/nickel transport system substrate-binding protein